MNIFGCGKADLSVRKPFSCSPLNTTAASSKSAFFYKSNKVGTKLYCFEANSDFYYKRHSS